MLNDMMTMSTTIWVVLLFVTTLTSVTFAVLWRTHARRVESLQQTVDNQIEQLEQLRERLHYTESQWQTLRATAAQERRASEDKLRTLEAAEQRMSQQFENLANRIFEQRSNQMQQQHQQSLQATLAPFKQQLESFKQQVQQQHSDETKERAALRSELLSLKTLNQQMAQEADALTRALKGDNKHQGNWGEVVTSTIRSHHWLMMTANGFALMSSFTYPMSAMWSLTQRSVYRLMSAILIVMMKRYVRARLMNTFSP